MVLPPPRDLATGNAIRTPDPMAESIANSSAEFEKKKKFYASASYKAKVRLEMIDLWDSIKAHNNQISKLIDYGLTQKTINILFDADYIKYQDEVQTIFKDRNLQYSKGPGDIVYLPAELLTKFIEAYIEALGGQTNATFARAALLNFINERRNIINAENQRLTSDISRFIGAGSSVDIVISFFEKIKTIIGGGRIQPGRQPRGEMMSWGTTQEGKEITTQMVEQLIRDTARMDDEGKQEIKDLITLLINYCLSSTTQDNIDALRLRIKELRKQYSSPYPYIVDSILNSAGGNVITGIYNILIEYLKKIDIENWKIVETTKINNLEEKDQPEKEMGHTIEDDAYIQITNANNLTPEQSDALLNIISKLGKNKDPAISAEDFTNAVTQIFITIINTSLKTDTIANPQIQTSSSSSSTSAPTIQPSQSGLLTNVLNYIRSNQQTILQIGSLILNPSPNKVASVIQEIIDSIRTQQINTYNSNIPAITPSTIPQSASNINDLFSQTTEQEDYEAFMEKKYDGVGTESSGNVNMVINIDGDLVPETPESIEQLEPPKIPSSFRQSLQKANELLKNISKKNRQSEQGIEMKKLYSEIFSESSNEDFNEDTDIIDIDSLTTEIKQLNENYKKDNKSDIVKRKLQTVMNELRNKYGKLSITKLFATTAINNNGVQITEFFNSVEESDDWISDNGFEFVSITQKYGLKRDYTSEDEKEKEKIFRYIPPYGGPPDDDGGGPPDGGGGDPSGGRGYRRQGPIRRRGQVFNGLTKKQYLLLLIVIVLLSTGAVSLEEVLKAGKDLNDNGTTSNPEKPPETPTKPDTPTDTPTDTPVVPVKPTKPDGTFNKIAHNEFWDSVGLSGVIDNYNGMVDTYNKMPAKDKKEYQGIVEKYYNKFATAVNIPTLKELKEARRRYDGLKKQYDSADGLSFDRINAIYIELKKSMTYLDKMTNKYLAVENQVFDIAKNKDDADVTIDDVDADISLQTKMNTSLGGVMGGITGRSNRAIRDTSYALLSKGMRERIARKIQGKGDFSSGLIAENQRFIDFSLVKPHEYPVGLGLDNPLVYRNKEYEIMQHRNNYANPQPYKVPSINRLIQISKQDKPQLHNVVQIDDRFNYDTGNTLISQKLQNPNVSPNTFSKSRLFNPEYHLEEINSRQKAINTMNDEIRCGPYVGIKENQYYQYANIQKKQNDELNKYPMTKEFKIVKPTLPKTIKEQRKLPNSYSLK